MVVRTLFSLALITVYVVTMTVIIPTRKL